MKTAGAVKTAFQYRFYPDTKQKLELNEWLRISRYWYNRQLGDRFDWWEMNRTHVDACPLVSSIADLRGKPNFYAQKKQLPVLKQDLVKVWHSGELLDFSRVDASVLQEVSKQVDKAFERFTVGDSNGNKSGKPRFKAVVDFKTMTFADGKAIKISLVRKGWMYIRLPKLGVVKVRMHREIPSGFIIKQVSVTQKADG